MIAPPYDVVGDEDVAALHRRSPYNVAHIESPSGGESRYTQAAALLETWQREGVLLREDAPALYVYEQVFRVHGEERRRRCLFARLRLSPFSEGEVRPHEHTMAAPKADRLRLLEATRTNVSPIMVSVGDPSGGLKAVTEEAAAGAPAFEAHDARGELHRLWVIADPSTIERAVDAAVAARATIADGHHRYETALGYLESRGDAATEGDGWVLAGIVAEDDPGLVVLPTHRIVLEAEVPADFTARLGDLYTIEALAADMADLASTRDDAAVQRLWAAVQAGAETPGTFGMVGLDGPSLLVLRPRSAAAIDAAMPPSWSAASRQLDVLILGETILAPLLGIGAEELRAGRVAYSEDATEVWRRTQSGEARLGFLVNPTRIDQVVAVADAGEVMPQKSTFYYPKLATGMVLNPLD